MRMRRRPPSETVQVFVRVSDVTGNRTLVLHVASTGATGRDALQAVRDRPGGHQVVGFFFGGHVLDLTRCLAEYGVRPESTLFAITRT